MPTWLLYTFGVLIFAVALLLSIALHEIGHMVPAKKFGVKVTQYMVGFGPTLWSRKRGETEYGVKAVPLGGYIRMIGMVPPRTHGGRSRWPRRLASAVEDFRRVSRAEVEPGDQEREFYRLTPGKKMIVMLGGPVMNLVIYLVLTIILIGVLGVPKSETTTTVGAIEKCVVPANSAAAQRTTCPAGAKPTPAFGALQPGDEFVSIDGTKITSWDQLTSLIRPAAGRQLDVVVRRNDRDVALRITPTRNLNYTDDTSKKTAEVGFIGFEPASRSYFSHVGVTGVPEQIGSQLNLGVQALGHYPEKIVSLYRTVFEGQQRDPQGAVGVVGISRISGDFAASKAFTVKEKLYTLIGLIASVNLLLFFFNLLPLLPLDGGHVAGAIYEAARRGWARLRARRRPGVAVPAGASVTASSETEGTEGTVKTRSPIFVDTAQMLPIMYGVASILVVVTLLTLYADIVKPINVTGG